MKKPKYSPNDLQQAPDRNDRIALAILFLANEVHELGQKMESRQEKQ